MAAPMHAVHHGGMSDSDFGRGPARTPAAGLRPGDPGYRRALVAVLFAGLASFQALYCTQALLPVFVDELRVDPATAALTVSATTGALAVAVVPVSVLSERFGRRPVLLASAVSATALGFLVALAPGAPAVILLRGLQGLLVAGVPAVAMTYVAEEVHQDYVPTVMGLYISGTTVGGLLGRIIPSVVLEFAGWRVALAASATVAFAFALATWRLLPRQRRFAPKSLTLAGEGAAIARHLRDPRLVGLYVLAFLFMGAFVSLYNYLGFRLSDRFGLSPALAGFVFLLYLAGTFSSARAGGWARRTGRRRLIAVSVAAACAGLALAALPHLGALLAGVALFTGAFFVAHSLSSSAVGLVARADRAEASSMYLFSYYAGSSVIGWVSGHVFEGAGWAGFVPWLAALSLVAGAAALYGLRGIAEPHRAG